MTYLVKELFLTLQGEGAHAGRAAVFCRFSGCNLWTGREEHRAIAICQFCDTDFVGTDGPGGGKFPTAELLADAVVSTWAAGGASEGVGVPYVVCTGGEPLLQLDDELVTALHAAGIEIAIETNGTLAVPDGIDWVCVSPKAGADFVVAKGNELKLVFPQINFSPLQFEGLEFEHFYLQPMDGLDRKKNTDLAVAYCLEHPNWRLSTQTHKYLEIP